VTTPLKPNDIVDWQIPATDGDYHKVVMVVEVQTGTVWLTDGYSRVGYVLGPSTFGELRLVDGPEADAHRDRISKLWEVHGDPKK
jgi:hypothetical protein